MARKEIPERLWTMKRLFSLIERAILGLGSMHYDTCTALRRLEANEDIDEVLAWVRKRSRRRMAIFVLIWLLIVVWPFVCWVFLR